MEVKHATAPLWRPKLHYTEGVGTRGSGGVTGVALAPSNNWPPGKYPVSRIEPKHVLLGMVFAYTPMVVFI